MQPTHSLMVINILSVYILATEDELARGAQWYPLAHNIVVEWAETFGRSIANVACIVAALSPQLPWPRNLIVADDILHGHAPSVGMVIHRNARIAERIRDDNATQLDDYFKLGCKVRSFAANLAGNLSVVTVDTHGAQIAAGSPTANLRVDTWAKYEPVVTAYTAAAQRAKILPSEMQAITWLVWKRLYPAGNKQALRRTY